MNISNIPIKLHWTYWFLFVIIIFPFANFYQFLFNLYLAIFISAMVLAHELVHAITAQKFNCYVRKIELFALGGMAHIEEMINPTPRKEILITLAGPMTNIVFAFFFMGVHALLVLLNIVAPNNQFFMAAWFINLILGVFNLFPAFPMDGGRILRAALKHFVGHYKATKFATSVSFVFSGLMACGAIYIGNPVLLFVSAFIAFISYKERQTLDGVI